MITRHFYKTVKSAKNTVLPATFFIVTSSHNRQPCKAWGVIIEHVSEQAYILYIYMDDIKTYETYLPFAKAMFSTLSIH